MTEHEHRWILGIHPKFKHVIIRCDQHDGACAAWKTIEQAETMLNEPTTLKREYTEFRADVRGALSQPSNPAVSNSWIVRQVALLADTQESDALKDGEK